MTIQFGSFDGICQTAALVVCPLVGADRGIEPSCYSRDVEIAGTLIFQPCESVGRLSERRVVVPNPPRSNMLRTYRGDYHDCYYDLHNTE